MTVTSDTQQINAGIKNGLWLIKFHANSCGHCINMRKDWDDFVKDKDNKTMFAEKGISIGDVESSHMQEVEFNKEIQGYPTIRLYKDGNPVGEFEGERTKQGFEDYVKNIDTTDTNQLGGGRKRRRRRSNKNKKRSAKRRQRGGSCITPSSDCLHSSPQAQLADAGHSNVSECAHAYRYGVGGSTGGKRKRTVSKRKNNKKSKRNRNQLNKRRRRRKRRQRGGNGDGFYLSTEGCRIGGLSEVKRYDASVHNGVNRYEDLNN
jgi:thiol-disulfide isomerase/thioredoxin